MLMCFIAFVLIKLDFLLVFKGKLLHACVTIGFGHTWPYVSFFASYLQGQPSNTRAPWLELIWHAGGVGGRNGSFWFGGKIWFVCFLSCLHSYL